MSSLARIENTLLAPSSGRAPSLLPAVWRDPSLVSPLELAGYIGALENAVAKNPESPDLRTWLGMAYAMNYQVYESMDALEIACQLDTTHFFAQFKYAELLYRLRALPRAEQETIKALNLAGNGWELSLARKQLQEIRMRIQEGTQKPEWTKPLTVPALVLIALFAILSSVSVAFR